MNNKFARPAHGPRRSIPSSLRTLFAVAGTCSVLSATSPSIRAAVNWTGSYDPGLGTLPTAQGWTLQSSGNSGTPAPTVNSGILHQGPTKYDEGEDWVRSDVASDFASTSGLVLEAKLQIVSSTYNRFPTTWRTGYFLFVSDDSQRVASLGISDTGVRLTSDAGAINDQSSAFIPFDTTSAFNTYEISAASGVITLFINGNSITTLPLATTGSSTGPDAWFFADGTLAGSSESNLQSLRWGNVSIPEPCTVGLMLVGCPILLLKRKRPFDSKG